MTYGVALNIIGGEWVIIIFVALVLILGTNKLPEAAKKNGQSLVMDPFLGSGQVAVISNMMERRYAGFEIVKEYYDFAQRRLQSGGYGLEKNTN